MKERIKDKLRLFLSTVVLFLLGISCITLGFLAVESSEIKLISDNQRVIKTILPIAVTLVIMIAFILQGCDNYFIFRLTVIFFCLVIAVCFAICILRLSGVEEIISSAEKLRAVIKSYGKFTVPAFIIFQICQVVFLPVPSIVAFGVGVALFGVVKTAIISYFSILIASVIAFLIGRKLGYRAVSWLVGKKALNKGLNLIRGKDEMAITLMLVFPFFPDDLLCFMSGLTSMTLKRFVLTVAITRLISILFLTFTYMGIFKRFITNPVLLFWLIFLVIASIICIYLYRSAKKRRADSLR